MTCSPDTVADALDELAGQEDQQAVAAQRAAALLDLARTGDAEPVFEALAEPGRFPGLLHDTGHPDRRRQRWRPPRWWPTPPPHPGRGSDRRVLPGRRARRQAATTSKPVT